MKNKTLDKVEKLIFFGCLICIGWILYDGYSNAHDCKPISVIRPYLKDPVHSDQYNRIFPEDLDYLEDHGFNKGTMLPSGLKYE